MTENLFKEVLKELELSTKFKLKKLNTSTTKNSIRYCIPSQIISTGKYRGQVMGSITELHTETDNWNQRIVIGFALFQENNLGLPAENSLILSQPQFKKFYNQLEQKIEV